MIWRGADSHTFVCTGSDDSLLAQKLQTNVGKLSKIDSN